MAPAQAEVEMSIEDEKKELAKYDLTQKLTPFLDKHLIFPILHFLKELDIYKAEDLARAEIQLLSDTNMIDFAADKYEELGEEVPESLNEKRTQVLEKLQTARDNEIRLLETLEDEESVKRMQTMKSMLEICDNFDVTQAQIDGLVSYAKLQFECGNYSLSSELLKHYRVIVEKESDRMTSKMGISCLWGSIASCLLNQRYEDASEHIHSLNELLDTTKMPKKEVLMQKTWLLHWSLTALFNSDNVPTKVLEIFLHEKSLSVMSLSCPWLFRYVSACLILHKRLRPTIKEIVWIIQQETEQCSNDPINRFLSALYVDLDFDKAQEELLQCRYVCKADAFLAKHWKDFEENARLQIFETYCRIHQCINIDMIASKINMTPQEAELWIVKLIQNAKLDARIDAERGTVVMSKEPPSIYHQVIEKTKNLSFRSTMLLSNLEKRENEKKFLGN